MLGLGALKPAQALTSPGQAELTHGVRAPFVLLEHLNRRAVAVAQVQSGLVRDRVRMRIGLGKVKDRVRVG